MVDQILERLSRSQPAISNVCGDFPPTSLAPVRIGSRSAMVDQLLESLLSIPTNKFERLRRLPSNKHRSSPILALLADALLEIQEQVDADNENSDWEETQNRNAGDDVILCSQLMLHHITVLHMNI
ncbi:hypothetical protein ACS0TY_001761 [Phlomoides rotata]